MGEQYLRKVIVEIFPANGKSKIITDLRVKFACGKLNKAKINDAKIEIYNLADETRKLVEDKKTRIRLSAGYLGLGNTEQDPKKSKANIEQLFVGNVTKVIHKVASPDIITEIKVGDGDNHYRNSRHTKGYPPGTKLNTVLTDLNSAMALNKGAQDGIPDKTYAHGITLSGLTKDHLDQLTDANGLQWSIQDESLQIVPKNGFTAEEIIIIGPDTGMVGSPDQTLNGIEFQCLLNPKLRPERRVQLESHFVKGIFILKKVEHNGDSMTGDFLSKCQAVSK